MPYKIEITEVPDLNGDGATDLSDIELLLKSRGNNLTILDGDGDFRSEESIEFLKEADIVVTNPPFSLFREFIAQLLEYDKKFIIIGNKNAMTYKEFFPLVKEDLVWIGYNSPTDFLQPNGSIKKQMAGLTRWFTNLDVKKRHEEMILYKKYTPSDYRKYENYDAINVDKVTDIPQDYPGAIGVPITFLDKYNPDQFSIIGLGIANLGLSVGVRPYLPEHKKYRKEVQHKGAVDGDLYMLDENGHPLVPYARILIKRRTHEN